MARRKRAKALRVPNPDVRVPRRASEPTRQPALGQAPTGPIQAGPPPAQLAAQRAPAPTIPQRAAVTAVVPSPQRAATGQAPLGRGVTFQPDVGDFFFRPPTEGGIVGFETQIGDPVPAGPINVTQAQLSADPFYQRAIEKWRNAKINLEAKQRSFRAQGGMTADEARRRGWFAVLREAEGKVDAALLEVNIAGAQVNERGTLADVGINAALPGIAEQVGRAQEVLRTTAADRGLAGSALERQGLEGLSQAGTRQLIQNLGQLEQAITLFHVEERAALIRGEFDAIREITLLERRATIEAQLLSIQGTFQNNIANQQFWASLLFNLGALAVLF